MGSGLSRGYWAVMNFPRHLVGEKVGLGFSRWPLTAGALVHTTVIGPAIPPLQTAELQSCVPRLITLGFPEIRQAALPQPVQVTFTIHAGCLPKET